MKKDKFDKFVARIGGLAKILVKMCTIALASISIITLSL